MYSSYEDKKLQILSQPDKEMGWAKFVSKSCGWTEVRGPAAAAAATRTKSLRKSTWAADAAAATTNREIR